MQRCKKKNTFNYDETSYDIINVPKMAIRKKCTECVKIDCKNNPKENFTLGLTISKGGSFLKPLLITKGKTSKSLNKFDLKNKLVGCTNNSGWADDDCIIIVLNEISKVTKNEKSILLMDKYKSHTTQKVKDYANEKNINIIYIPTGLTNKYQPLDVSINGILKNKAIKKYSKYLVNFPDKKYTHKQCIEDFLENKKEISKSTIIHSFNCLEKINK